MCAHFILILRMTRRSLSELRSTFRRIFLNKAGVQSDNAFHFESILAGNDSEPHISDPEVSRCLVLDVSDIVAQIRSSLSS